MASVSNTGGTGYIKASEEELSRFRQVAVGGESNSAKNIIGRVLFWALVAGIILYTLFPFYWALASSLKSNNELVQNPPTLWPMEPTLENYRRVLTDGGFMRALLNSTVVSLSVVLLSLTIGTLASYAISRLNFRGRKVFLYLILSMTMFPGIAIIGSLFQIMRQVKAYDTLWGLVVVYLTFALPFTVWVLSNFFRAMPSDLEDSAQVDGANWFQSLRHILIPLAIPGMVTTGLLAFIEAWSEFLYARTFTVSNKAKTVQVAISDFTGNTQFEVPFGTRMAAAVVVTVPLLIGVLILQRRIVAGLTAGAVKG